MLWTFKVLVDQASEGIRTLTVDVHGEHPILGEIDGEVRVRIGVGNSVHPEQGSLKELVGDDELRGHLVVALKKWVRDEVLG